MTASNGFEFPPAFFVTGTDTDVGKTVVSAILTLGLQAAYWKPIQSGLTPITDTQWLQQNTGLSSDHLCPEQFRLHEPLSPHAAAAIDGVQIHLSDFSLPLHSRSHLVVEGAGGLRVPLNDTAFMTDLIQQLNLPVLLVARSTLGTINHTLLSIEHLRLRQIPLLGVVLNGPVNPGNRAAIVQYGQVPILAEIPPFDSLTPETLLRAFQTYFFSHPERPIISGP